MYQHILLAIDHDKDGAQLLNKAYAVAASHGARLSLLHVVDFIPSDSADPMGLSIDASLPQQLATNARSALDTLCTNNPAPEGLLVDTHISIGAAKHEIVTQASERGCDLIVIGHHNHRGLGHLLGHTDESVLHHAPCDLLAIKLHD